MGSVDRDFAVFALLVATSLTGCSEESGSAVDPPHISTEVTHEPVVNTVPIDIGIGPGEAITINRGGDIAGTTANGDGFLWRDGTVEILALHPSYEGLSDRGHVLGSDAVWYDGELDLLGGLGGAWVKGTAINAHGLVIGQAGTTEGHEHAFLWENGVTTDLGTLGGNSAVATAINDEGDVVGYSETPTGAIRAFRWRGGIMSDLGTGDDSRAYAVSNAGHIAVIMSGGPTGTTLVLVSDGATIYVDISRPQWSFLDGTERRDIPLLRVNSTGHVAFLNQGCSGEHPQYFDSQTLSAEIVSVCQNPPRCCVTLSDGGRISWFARDKARTFRVGELPPQPETVTDVFQSFVPFTDLVGGQNAIVYTTNGRGQYVGSALAVTGVQHATLWRALAPDETVQGILSDVENLVASGVLRAGVGAGLRAKLNVATAMLNDGKLEPALRQLEAFANQVGSTVDAGHLGIEEGQALIDVVRDLVDALLA